ncbi:PucR family transcriptional regulator [Pseudonocardia spinosispora]|uniref:PucR family transcriptional regulator n=1 Tax=Pseudonocardia spinosispora TaxID=103441 RepID=UPI0004239BD2|nr:PucR family transcriptional regulator [Pseudonocardia spinosispora]
MGEVGEPRGLPAAGPTTRQLVRDIGPALLRLVSTGATADDPLASVVIHPPTETAVPEPNCVVLGIGAKTEAEVLGLLAATNPTGPGVVAVKAPMPSSISTVRTTGPAIIEVSTDASWMHVATTIRDYLIDYTRARIQPDDDSTDLFALANAIYTALNAPVTIEDRFSALLAWSAGQDQTDPERITTILGRAVHQRTLEQQRERGEFQRLRANAGPVYFAATEPGYLSRVAIAVRAGTEVLGYLWVAVAEPLDSARAHMLEQFALVVAPQIAGLRTETAHARRQREELAAAVLAGSADLVGAGRLQLGDGPLCVLAAASRVSAGGHSPIGNDPRVDLTADAVAVDELRRFADTLEYYLAAVHPRSVTVRGTGVVYALLAYPVGATQALDSTTRLARDFLARTPLTDDHVIAAGGPSESIGRITTIRSQVDATVRAMRHPSFTGQSVCAVEDAALSVLLLHLADMTDSLGLPDTTGALRRLISRDGPTGVLADTMAAYLDAAGNTEVAARALRIHVNTMRYRLRRIRDISGLDFAHGDTMLLTHLQLRVRTLRTPRTDDPDKNPPAD